jgi:hypothetical protein
MAFIWSALPTPGVTLIEDLPNFQIDELRTNADWLDNNTANVNYNGTVYPNHDISVLTGYQGSVCWTNYIGDKGGGGV